MADEHADSTSTASDDPAENSEPKSRWDLLRDWLAHPLVLLLAGSVVTGVLVPSITHGWQSQQMAQDLKTKVIGEVTDASTGTMSRLEVAVSPQFQHLLAGRSLHDPSVTGQYENWMRQGATIGSEINAYFPDNNLPTHWANLYGLVKNLYLLTYTSDPGLRGQYLQSLRTYFDFHKIRTGVDWNVLQTADLSTPEFRHNWTLLERQVLRVRDEINQGIMDAPNPPL